MSADGQSVTRIAAQQLLVVVRSVLSHDYGATSEDLVRRARQQGFNPDSREIERALFWLESQGEARQDHAGRWRQGKGK